MFMGEKFGRDPIWEGHLATEIYSADVEIEAILHEQELPLSRILAMKPGDTVLFDRAPSDPIRLRCGEVDLTEAIMGHIGNNVSVRVTRPLNPPKVTMADFEAIDANLEG
jgi:flagellar motor switch protein FliM